ncbi:MAG: universal stress protein [Bacteroidota bacterium]
MKKILVTTDFSAKSKAGLYFAIQLASQHDFDLTFFYSHFAMTPTSWGIEQAESFKKAEAQKHQTKLELFVEKIYKDMNIEPVQKKCVITSSVFPDSNIREYAAENNFDFICISTRGAGNLERILGTNTANLINQSEVPVIAVPYRYKRTKIESILYASDLANFEKELQKVTAFAKPLQAAVELLHFTSPLETAVHPDVLEATKKKLAEYNITTNFKTTDFAQTLVANIEAAIRKTKPSMMIMFTEQNRTLFQKIFLSSKSAEYSFNPKVPLLVFNKS